MALVHYPLFHLDKWEDMSILVSNSLPNTLELDNSDILMDIGGELESRAEETDTLLTTGSLNLTQLMPSTVKRYQA